VAAAELATYGQCKQFLLGNNIMQDNIYTHFAASFIAGFVATASSSPIGMPLATSRAASVRSSPSLMLIAPTGPMCTFQQMW
jgi:hypothetical protein